MRLVRIRLQDFRGVGTATVDFGDGVTVVEGPNEVGKSSVAEAIRLIRQYKASSKHGDIKAIKPVDRDTGPQVELELTTGTYQLSYRKRWLRKPLTELSVRAPAPEQVSGDEAHERFLGILTETLDTDLLDALEVIQGQSLDQAQLAQVNALHRALGEPGDDAGAHDDLMARVEEEYRRYFTAGGRPTGDYAQAPGRVEPLETEVAELTDRSAEMDRLAAEHARAQRRLDELAGETVQAETSLLEHERAATALEQLKSTVASAQRDLADADRTLADARDARTAREQLAATVDRRQQACQEREHTLTGVVEDHEQARQRLAEAERRVAERDRERSRLREAAVTAQRRWRRCRDRQMLTALSERVARAQEHERCRREGEAEAGRATVDEEAVERLQELETELRIAESARQAAAARVVVRRLGDATVTVDGTGLEADHDHDVSVLEPVDVEVEGVLTVNVHPGNTPADLQDRLSTARSAWDQALRQAEVSTLAEARSVAQRARQARAEGERARAALETVLEGSTLEELEAKLAALQSRHAGPTEEPDAAGAEAVEAAQESGPPGDETAEAGEPADDDLEALQEAADRASAAERSSEEDLSVAQHERDRLREAAETARDGRVRAETGLQQSVIAVQEATTELEQARQGEDDAAIEARIEAAQQERDTRQAAVVGAETRLQAADPSTLEMQLENARGLVESKRTEQQRTQKNVTEVATLLDHHAAEGIYDRLAQCTAELEAARSQLDRLDRSAQAARLLRQTLVRHREEAQRKYVAPFKERIERLGRVVFGGDFSVQVSDGLCVTHRTLGGRTVEFASLSAGAREQMGLIGRLACAQLVDPAEGAPVVLDDTLGFADPGRLEALNVVLNDVGRTAQVVLLTCQPQRFSALGGASVVSLSPGLSRS